MSIRRKQSKNIKFSNVVTVTDLETFVNTVPMKNHNGLVDINKKYENLVWYSVTFQYTQFLEYIYSLYTDELEICFQKTSELLQRIIVNGRSPILDRGGGRNRILGAPYKPILYNLILTLQSIISVRKQVITIVI